MRLASFTARGRTSFGVVEGEGVVDLRLRFGVRYTTLLELLRAGALHEVKPAITGVRAVGVGGEGMAGHLAIALDVVAGDDRR